MHGWERTPLLTLARNSHEHGSPLNKESPRAQNGEKIVSTVLLNSAFESTPMNTHNVVLSPRYRAFHGLSKNPRLQHDTNQRKRLQKHLVAANAVKQSFAEASNSEELVVGTMSKSVESRERAALIHERLQELDQL